MGKKDELIYGLRPIEEAIEAGKEIERVLLQKGLQGKAFADLLQTLKSREIAFQFVPPEKLARITRSNHQGIIAFITSVEYQAIENIIPATYEQGEVPLIVVLDRVTDVRNTGAIARTALCAGAHALVIPLKGAARITADAIKTSAGALLSLPVYRSPGLKMTLSYLKLSGLKLVAATEKASMDYDEVDLTQPLAIIMGSEEDGISPDILRMADDLVRIPLTGPVNSLNVSVATGILLFEAVRQRRRAHDGKS